MIKRIVLVGALLLGGVALVLFLNQDQNAPPQSSSEGAIVEVVVPLESSRVAIPITVDEPDCPQPFSEAERIARRDEAQAEIESATLVLTQSDNPEHLLAAAMMMRWEDPAFALEVLENSVKVSNDPLHAWVVLTLCSNSGTWQCDMKTIEEKSIRADTNNGEMWAQLAVLRLDQGRIDEAADAMRHAITAPQFESHYFDQVMLIERALKAASNLPFIERVVGGFGFASAMPRNVSSLTAQCEQERDGVWLELCEQLGHRMAEDGDTLLSKLIGLSVQRLALNHRGDSAGLAELSALQDSLRQSTGDLDWNKRSESLFMNDETALPRFLDDLNVFGEVEAFRRLKSEMHRLEQDPDYDQCNFSPAIRF